MKIEHDESYLSGSKGQSSNWRVVSLQIESHWYESICCLVCNFLKIASNNIKIYHYKILLSFRIFHTSMHISKLIFWLWIQNHFKSSDNLISKCKFYSIWYWPTFNSRNTMLKLHKFMSLTSMSYTELTYNLEWKS